jgi:hypothetical protein
VGVAAGEQQVEQAHGDGITANEVLDYLSDATPTSPNF